MYRIWISVRIPKFEIDDFIDYENKIIRITGISKISVLGVDISTHKKHNIPMKKMEDINLVKKSDEVQTTTVISKSPQFIQILDPVDYSAMDINMSEEYDKLNVGEEVKLIKIENNVYLLN